MIIATQSSGYASLLTGIASVIAGLLILFTGVFYLQSRVGRIRIGEITLEFKDVKSKDEEPKLEPSELYSRALAVLSEVSILDYASDPQTQERIDRAISRLGVDAKRLGRGKPMESGEADSVTGSP